MLRCPTLLRPTLLRWVLVGWLIGNWMLCARAAETDDRKREQSERLTGFIGEQCLQCHSAEKPEAGLDLSRLVVELQDAGAVATWTKIHDRVVAGEMPPDDALTRGETEQFTNELFHALVNADAKLAEASGRAVWRRLNRFEYENSVRDLLHAPWLQLKEILPEDGVAHRFNKVGEALDISHVQMARYLQAAEYALRQVIASQSTQPSAEVKRYYAREQTAFNRKVKFNEFNRSPERATFPLIGTEADLDVLRDPDSKFTVGDADPERREQEAFGVVASTYEPLEIRFNSFTAPQPGKYRLRLRGYTFWAGPGEEARWWRPDREHTFPGRRHEPVSVYSESPPRQLRKLGEFDFEPEPTTQELEVWLLQGESIRPDAVRLFRSRPSNWHNPLAEKDGSPGVAFQWLEVEGPLHDQWPPVGHRLLFGDLALEPNEAGSGMHVVSREPVADARRLLKEFLMRAYRRPIEEHDVDRFMTVVETALSAGNDFQDAMVAGYSAVLCSPAFICLQEEPGQLDSHALAARLSYFLWNGPPDAPLREVAEDKSLCSDAELEQQTVRLLDDPKSRRFVNAFLDYWLDLRRVNDTSPDATLYPDYYLDDSLVDAATSETQLFLAELLARNAPVRDLVVADYAILNERLAEHYGVPNVVGVDMRLVQLPHDSPRGGLLTQASILKVTANGTTTSPVTRGAWITERLLGMKPPPPPPSVPAVEPDTRGAKTIREQLALHRSEEACNVCHKKIDPTGFALENFDVLGGFRERYRSLGEEGERVENYGKNGQPFTFRLAQTVDASGELPDGRTFQNIFELKQHLASDERQLARNLVHQLLVYSTGAAARFSDRPEIERILDQAQAEEYGVRSIVLALVQSPLFRYK